MHVVVIYVLQNLAAHLLLFTYANSNSWSHPLTHMRYSCENPDFKVEIADVKWRRHKPEGDHGDHKQTSTQRSVVAIQHKCTEQARGDTRSSKHGEQRWIAMTRWLFFVPVARGAPISPVDL